MNFDAISVREDELRDYLESKLPEKHIIKVLDPTLLAGRGVFDDLTKEENAITDPYILIHQVIREKDQEIQSYAKLIANKLGCDIYEIKNSQLYISSNNRAKVTPELINPTKFVNYFKCAKYIITTSFHGTAFSLLFNKPFNVISVSPEVDSRAQDILQQLDLEDRMISLPINSCDLEIKWDAVNKKMEQLREPSVKFLNKSLNY